MLPRVKLIYQNGMLGAVGTSPDGLLGIIVNAKAVSETFELYKPYLITSSDLSSLGITEKNNPGVVKLIKEFYGEAEQRERVQVYLMGVSDTTTMSDMLDYSQPNSARRIIEVSKGAVRGIIVKHIPAEGYKPTISEGLDVDVYTAVNRGQQLGNWAANEKFAPIFIAIEGHDYQGDPTELRSLIEMTNNRVGVLIGDTEPDTGGAAMGLLAGRVATVPVQRNIGRVKDGAVSATTIYIGGTEAEQANVEALHEKGYISFRTFVGRAGYFFTDDNLATLPTDDYKYLTYRRTIDKAYRIGYNTMLNELLDEIPLTGAGTIQPVYAKHWEAVVENAIATQMTANGELSADPEQADDKGVTAFVDPAQNVAKSGEVYMDLAVRPFGYGRYVNIRLGFQVTK